MPIEIGYGIDLNGDDKITKIFSKIEKTETETLKVRYFCSNIESEKKYLEEFSAATKAIVPINATANLKAAFDFSRHQQTATGEIGFIITIAAIERTASFKMPDNIEEDPQVQAALTMLKANKIEFYSRYGSAFISEVTYGNTLSIVVKFKNVNSDLKQKLSSDLGVNVAGLFNIENSQELNKVMRDHHITCEITFNCEGFRSDQLPSMQAVKDLEALKQWIDDFTKQFYSNTVPTTNVFKFNTSSYVEIYGTAANALLDKQLHTDYYRNAIASCERAIALYEKYYETVHAQEPLRELLKRKKALLQVSAHLELNHDYLDPAVVETLVVLQSVISFLNDLKMQPKMFQYKSTDLRLEATICCGMNYQYTSPIFRLKIQEPLTFSRLFVKFNGTPISGLKLFASTHPKVPQDTLCESFSKPVTQDLTAGVETTVELPVGADPRDLFFAFRLDTSEKIHGAIPKAFNVETGLVFKQAEPTLDINVPKVQLVA